MSKYRQFAPYVLRQWRWLSAIFVLTALSSASSAMQPWPMKLLVDFALGGTLKQTTADTPLPVRSHLGDTVEVLGLHTTPGSVIVFAGVASFLLFLVNSLLTVGLSLCWSQGGQRMVYSLAADVFYHLQRLSLLFHGRRHVGDSLSRLTEDTWCIYTMTDSLLLGPIQQLVSLAILASVGFALDPVLGMMTVAVAPLLAISTKVFGKHLKQRSRSGRESKARLTSFVHQTLGAIPIVQIFGTERRNLERFQSLAKDAVVESQRTSLMSSAFGLVNGLITTAGIAVILYMGSVRVVEQVIPLGTLLVFLAYVRQMQSASGGLFDSLAKLKAAEASVDRLWEVMESKERVQEAKNATTLPELTSSGRSVQFQNVTFGYESGRTVLSNICLDVKPGEVIALVGTTGAGKSTLVSLVPRFFDPWDGAILVDGQDVRRTKLESLRSAVSIVLQEPFLFPITVAENIAYGKPGATRDEIVEAATAASADEFIRALPDGYDTLLGEHGATLSGGERQRISIARAFLKDAPILILDEPTSALDVETESTLLATLNRLMQGRTTFMIAHRLSTIRIAHRIVVLESGSIVQTGTHEQLLRQAGCYRRFYETQVVLVEEKVMA